MSAYRIQMPENIKNNRKHQLLPGAIPDFAW